MKRLQLLFIFCVVFSAAGSIQGFWDTATKSPISEHKTDLPSDGKSGKKSIQPVYPNPSIFCIDGFGNLFREYLEQEKNFLQNRLQHISFLISKSYQNPCVTHSVYPGQWIPDYRPDFPYVDYNHIINKNNIVDDKSSGKNLHIILNLTGFIESDVKFEIKDSRIMVEAQQEAEPYKYVKWTYLLPIGTNPSTITHQFDNGYVTIQGTLSEDVNFFSSQQTLKTSIKHQKKTSFTHIHNYPHLPSSGKSWFHNKK